MLTLNVKQIIGLRRWHQNGMLGYETGAAAVTAKKNLYVTFDSICAIKIRYPR